MLLSVGKSKTQKIRNKSSINHEIGWNNIVLTKYVWCWSAYRCAEGPFFEFMASREASAEVFWPEADSQSWIKDKYYFFTIFHLILAYRTWNLCLAKDKRKTQSNVSQESASMIKLNVFFYRTLLFQIDLRYKSNLKFVISARAAVGLLVWTPTRRRCTALISCSTFLRSDFSLLPVTWSFSWTSLLSSASSPGWSWRHRAWRDSCWVCLLCSSPRRSCKSQTLETLMVHPSWKV